MTKSQERLLARLRNMSAEDLTPEDLEDLEELEQLEKQTEETPEEEKEKPLNDMDEIKKGMGEILKCLKPELTTQEKVEIPTPDPVITNQEVEKLNQDQLTQEQLLQTQQASPIKENQLKKFLKSIW